MAQTDLNPSRLSSTVTISVDFQIDRNVDCEASIETHASMLSLTLGGPDPRVNYDTYGCSLHHRASPRNAPTYASSMSRKATTTSYQKAASSQKIQTSPWLASTKLSEETRCEVEIRQELTAKVRQVRIAAISSSIATHMFVL